MAYLSVANFWKYQNADAWKKAKTHPPWFKHYVHRDRELDALPYPARLLFWELLAAATRYENVLGPGGLNGSEAKLSDSEEILSWIQSETRVDIETIRETLPLLLQGGWLSQTKTARRSRKPSRGILPDPGRQDVDVDVDVDPFADATGEEPDPTREGSSSPRSYETDGGEPAAHTPNGAPPAYRNDPDWKAALHWIETEGWIYSPLELPDHIRGAYHQHDDHAIGELIARAIELTEAAKP